MKETRISVIGKDEFETMSSVLFDMHLSYWVIIQEIQEIEDSEYIMVLNQLNDEQIGLITYNFHSHGGVSDLRILNLPRL